MGLEQNLPEWQGFFAGFYRQTSRYTLPIQRICQFSAHQEDVDLNVTDYYRRTDIACWS